MYIVYVYVYETDIIDLLMIYQFIEAIFNVKKLNPTEFTLIK